MHRGKNILNVKIMSSLLDQALRLKSTRSHMRDAALVVKDQGEIQIFFLKKEKYTIGRSPENDIQILSKGISRHHAILYKLQDSYQILDGSTNGCLSTNGIAVNNKRCHTGQLKDGDIITFCKGTYATLITVEDMKNNIKSNDLFVQKILNFLLKDEVIHRQCTSDQDFLEILPELIIHVDSNGKILDINESKDPVFSSYTKELVYRHLSKCFPKMTAQKILSVARIASQRNKTQFFDIEILHQKSPVACEIQITPGKGKSSFIVIRNINERKSIEKRLLYEAGHDTLTGLPNRSFFIQKVEYAILQNMKDRKQQFAVLLLDIDRFKMINDSLGHLAGDKFIIQISNRLRDCLRPEDIIARIGGDEFAILINNIDHIEDAIHITKRLQSELMKPVQLSHHELLPSASIGIAYSSYNYRHVDDVLRDADLAMYQAKASGRSCFELFDRQLHRKAVNLLRLDSDLRQAIRNHEFKLLYQPIICLKTNSLVGFEALLRWSHPARGTVGPAEFIQQAEEMGLIVPIGEWVLAEVCHQLKLWRQLTSEASSLTINVNLSSKQFYSLNLIQYIGELLEQNSLSPSSLKLEITESIIMENSRFSVDIFSQLKKLGVQICIDDFGTGYSSLSYLHHFPIDALKIDKSFVSEMDETSENTGFAITQSVVGLAHNLGVKVIAEGIESARHLAWLRNFQCDYGQGYFFAKPLEAKAATTLIERGLAWHYK